MAPSSEVETFGKLVQRLRNMLGLTQIQLAERVNYSLSNIKKIEQDKGHPSTELAELLADHLSIPVSRRDDFLTAAKGMFLPRSWIPLEPYLSSVPPDESSSTHLPLSPALFGRTVEIEILSDTWLRLSHDMGQLLLVAGEAGVGKSRLVEELLQDIAKNAHVLRVKCPEMQNPLAYTLFVEPLRTALAQHRTVGISNTWLAELSRLLPELMEQHLDLPLPPQLDPAAERRRLFDAICTTLVSLSASKPVVLFLDDLQWADASSLALLTYLSQWASTAPLLILGTYRPHEVSATHPLNEVQRIWQRLGRLTTVALEPLAKAAVFALLQNLTTWTGTQSEFGDLIYKETAGNPLFVIETVASLREEGRLPQDGDDWHVAFRDASITLPSQVQAVIENRLNQLDEGSRDIMTAVAVMRGEFGAAVIQTLCECSAMETVRGLERLLASGLLVEADQDRFTFRHDKIREVAYNTLSHIRRRHFHCRVAETMESQSETQRQMLLADLAYHYEQAGDQAQALHYHIQAAQLAQAQYAAETAIGHYRQALTLLKSAPDTLERRQQELDLLVALGLPVSAHYGNGSPEAERVFAQAEELGRQVGDISQHFRALYGLWLFYVHSANFQEARVMGNRLMELATSAHEPALLLEAQRIVSTNLFYLGEFVEARIYQTVGMQLYDPLEHHSHALSYNYDPAVAFKTYASLTHWLLGYPEQALQKSQDAVALARELMHPLSLTYALVLAMPFHEFRGEREAVQQRAQEAFVLADQRFPNWEASARFMQGWLMTTESDASHQKMKQGIDQMDEALDQYLDAGPAIFQPYFLYLLAQASGKIGEVADALAYVSKALTLVEQTHERWWEAELYRLKGDLLLLQAHGQAESTATACFLRALDVATRQQAQALKLRATLSLSRLWRKQRKEAEAGTLLREIYDWFTEGLDTADLVNAKVLLAELQPQ